MAMSKKKPSENRLESELQDLELRADGVRVPGADAPFFNAAGDLCLESDHRERALEYYGRAVDAYLKAERWEASAAICRKIVRIEPGCVRARCTLSWLAIGKGFVTEASEQVADYAEAARKAGREELAANQLRRMGEVACNRTLRITVAEQLLGLGADRASEHLFGAVFAELNTQARASQDEPAENWSLIRRAALMGPRDLRQGESLSYARPR